MKELSLKPCPQCKGKPKYNKTFDAFYCDKCNAWTEKACTDPRCEYCKNRPEKPAKGKLNGR